MNFFSKVIAMGSGRPQMSEFCRVVEFICVGSATICATPLRAKSPNPFEVK